MSLNMNPSERRCPIVLIPSLEPETALITYVERLRQQGFEHIIIIDDGSGDDYRHIFSALEQGGATLLVHEHNQGKGAAIKTGLRWIKEHAPQSFSIITVDSDGQHTVPDVVNMARAAAENPEALVLGQRDFSSTETPWKSSFGNKVATVAFAVLHHVHLADTQTGLRAFGQELLDDMLTLPGNGFEYETQMLVMAVKRQVPMVPVAISTVYENDNGEHTSTRCVTASPSSRRWSVPCSRFRSPRWYARVLIWGLPGRCSQCLWSVCPCMDIRTSWLPPVWPG